MSAAPIPEPHFYRLGFASQLVVWAMRKRLHLLSQGESERNVTEIFARAGLAELHAGLMSIVDVLLCGPSMRIQQHAVACPYLAPHEVSLLNALAYRQLERIEDSRASLGELFGHTGLRLVEPAVASIVAELDARRLRLTVIEGPAVASRGGAGRTLASVTKLSGNVTVH
jgi:hypothetical protein